MRRIVSRLYSNIISRRKRRLTFFPNFEPWKRPVFCVRLSVWVYVRLLVGLPNGSLYKPTTWLSMCLFSMFVILSPTFVLWRGLSNKPLIMRLTEGPAKSRGHIVVATLGPFIRGKISRGLHNPRLMWAANWAIYTTTACPKSSFAAFFVSITNVACVWHNFSETSSCVQDTKVVSATNVVHVAKRVNIWETWSRQQCCCHKVPGSLCRTVNPFTPELKKCILPTFQKAIVWVM